MTGVLRSDANSRPRSKPAVVHMTGDNTKPPLLLLHGWPGSFIEFEDPIAPLVTSIDPQIEAIISGSGLRYTKNKKPVSALLNVIL